MIVRRILTVDPEFARIVSTRGQPRDAAVIAQTMPIPAPYSITDLNQHHSESSRRGAIEGLRGRALGDDNEIARLMMETLPSSQFKIRNGVVHPEDQPGAPLSAKPGSVGEY